MWVTSCSWVVWWAAAAISAPMAVWPVARRSIRVRWAARVASFSCTVTDISATKMGGLAVPVASVAYQVNTAQFAGIGDAVRVGGGDDGAGLPGFMADFGSPEPRQAADVPRRQQGRVPLAGGAVSVIRQFAQGCQLRSDLRLLRNWRSGDGGVGGVGVSSVAVWQGLDDIASSAMFGSGDCRAG